MITHCICHNLPFLLILELAKKNNHKTLEELKEKEGICQKCCLCNKYVERMLETGETKFGVDIF